MLYICSIKLSLIMQHCFLLEHQNSVSFSHNIAICDTYLAQLYHVDKFVITDQQLLHMRKKKYSLTLILLCLSLNFFSIVQLFDLQHLIYMPLFLFNDYLLPLFCPLLDLSNTNRLTQLFSQVINLGKLCRPRLTQINHIIETVRKINNTTI